MFVFPRDETGFWFWFCFPLVAGQVHKKELTYTEAPECERGDPLCSLGITHTLWGEGSETNRESGTPSFLPVDQRSSEWGSKACSVKFSLSLSVKIVQLQYTHYHI